MLIVRPRLSVMLAPREKAVGDGQRPESPAVVRLFGRKPLPRHDLVLLDPAPSMTQELDQVKGERSELQSGKRPSLRA
jgi:hypothetical protein